jgi:hypothetical protein
MEAERKKEEEWRNRKPTTTDNKQGDAKANKFTSTYFMGRSFKALQRVQKGNLGDNIQIFVLLRYSYMAAIQ